MMAEQVLEDAPSEPQPQMPPPPQDPQLTSLQRHNKEFENAVRDIAQRVMFIDYCYDRAKCAEWVRRLAVIPNDTPSSAKLRNDYIQMLRIMVRNGRLFSIFAKPPPTQQIPPLPEMLGNELQSRIPSLPRSGPIAPAICRRSPDGRAYVSAKPIPGAGVFCYMCVSPDPTEGNQNV